MIGYTPTQQQVMDLIDKSCVDKSRLFILWFGGIRAGKTYGMVRAAIKHAEYRENSNYIVGGFTLRSIINNLVPYFKEICHELEIDYKIVEGGINPRVEIGSNRFLFYGGDKSGRDKNVQGATAVGLIIDEFELLNHDFIKQCEGRISNDNALRIYTSNKGQPYSWAKKEYYDRVVKGEIEGVLIDSNPKENTFIKEDFWKEKESEYDDYYRRRFIENEFTLELEPVYDVEKTKLDVDKAMLELTAIYSYSKYHFSIPFYKLGDVYIIGNVKGETSPVDISGLSPYGDVMVNSTASMLAREITQKRRNVRGYSDMFLPHKYELAQRAFTSGNVMVDEDAGHTIEALDTYSFAGIGDNPEANVIESVIEYLARMKRWQ